MDIQTKLETYRTQLQTQKGRVAELERALDLAKMGTSQLEGAILALEDLLREEPAAEPPPVTNGDASAGRDA